jgi:hypothetical protein
MTLKKLDDPASKDFWDYVEKSKQEWREQQPSWSRDLDERRESAPRNETHASNGEPNKSVLV